MHKKLEADLISLAHSILQMKNKEDVFALKAKAHQVYEKLALLAYVDEYINMTPNATTTKEALITKIASIENTVIENSIAEKEKEEEEEVITTSNTRIETENSFIEEETTSPLSTNTIVDESPTIHKEEFLVENKDKEEIPFTIKQALEQPIIQESLFEEPENTVEDSIKDEIIEQPFDELENILFGDDATDVDTISSIDEAPETTLQSILSSDVSEINDISFTEEILNSELSNVSSSETADVNDTAFIEEPKDTSTEEKEQVKEPIKERPFSVIKNTPPPIVEETPPAKEDITKKLTLEEELADTLSVDVMANLFEKAPVKKTINDLMYRDTIKIDLNDRIAFVKNLFEGNQEDFNRVISQLNTIKSEKDAKYFILKMIKPDYDWSTKEVYETRLLDIIERRFS